MKVDAVLAARPSTAAERGRAVEAAGYDGVWVGETNHDPFLMAAKAGEATDHITVGTSVAIAFARSPMTVAQQSWDLTELMQGRFVLGLGTQVKPHIERRFSMPWSHPAPRLREYVAAVRAIWAAWTGGPPLAFEGRFYHHSLMTPFFTPQPLDVPTPPIYLAAVGAGMAQVAGEVADGLFVHGFNTASYLREVTLPAVRRGQERAGADRPTGFTVCGPVFVVTGDTEAAMDQARVKVRETIAFYGSTPGYRAVLDHHGWGDLQPELTALSRAGRWAEMGNLIDDTMLATFAVIAEPERAGAELVARYGDLVDRITLYTPYDAAPGVLERVARAVRGSA